MKQENRPAKNALGFKRVTRNQTNRQIGNQVKNRPAREAQLHERPQAQPSPYPASRKNWTKTLFAGFVIALALTIMATPFAMNWLEGVFQTYSAQSDSQATDAPAFGNEWPTPPPTYVPPAIVQATTLRAIPTPTPLPPPTWEEINYLTSIKFTASSVVDVQKTTSIALLGEVLTDRLLLKAVGEVQVGVDLNNVENMQIDGSAISFDIPAPVITSIELLPDQTQIYSSLQVIFLSQYPGLEQEALEQAKSQLRAEIEENDSMMKLAEEMTKLNLTEFLRSAGFEEVNIQFTDAQTMEGTGRSS